MKISEVYPDYVFQRLGVGKKVVAVDFGKGKYIDLAGQTIFFVQRLVEVNTDIKFYQLDEEESEG